MLPYFHTPTPPVSAQTQESPYGTFGQLGNQLGHQAQGSHLGGFGGGDYGYGESQRVSLEMTSFVFLLPFVVISSFPWEKNIDTDDVVSLFLLGCL